MADSRPLPELQGQMADSHHFANILAEAQSCNVACAAAPHTSQPTGGMARGHAESIPNLADCTIHVVINGPPGAITGQDRQNTIPRRSMIAAIVARTPWRGNFIEKLGNASLSCFRRHVRCRHQRVSHNDLDIFKRLLTELGANDSDSVRFELTLLASRSPSPIGTACPVHLGLHAVKAYSPSIYGLLASDYESFEGLDSEGSSSRDDAQCRLSDCRLRRGRWHCLASFRHGTRHVERRHPKSFLMSQSGESLMNRL